MHSQALQIMIGDSVAGLSNVLSIVSVWRLDIASSLTCCQALVSRREAEVSVEVELNARSMGENVL